ncbi:MAG: energy-coupling factor transporter ATPase [Clostridia bacterium]|nr:energy-coupling factor transporter ATPase [Clostridia bacterium]
MEKIKIENLTFTYPQCKIPALDNINITINSGEFVCICGKSGCGKSTLLRQIKPILSPYGARNGIVYFDNKNVSDLSQREQSENIGFVLQNPDNQIVCDKVWHELAFGLESLSYKDSEIRARVAEMAAFFGIQDWYYKNVTELSGGQKQLLNLASVMAIGPSVLILDEPTSQLDPIAAHDFLDTIAKINKELGTTIILSEHRLEEALPLADRVIVMDKGSVIADGDAVSVGNILKEQNHDMLEALPTPMRVSYSVEHEYDTPITVRDARVWLSKMPLDTEIKFTDEKSNSGEGVLKCNEVWFRYEKDTPDILKGLSLEVRENELYAIVGGNGAGKTTLLSAIMGANTPYCGKIEIQKDKKIVCLPQNPGCLFVKKTVLLDLWEMVEKSKDTKEAKEQKIQNVIRFCELENLLQSHPYDLSGGEQQRAALAKVLLCEPDILLLDEPTKGLDAHFKKKLAKMLKGMQKSDVTILMVSHDIEFCAKFADRLGMFFDGHIVSEDEPRTFFSGKSFYTTSANRIARDIRGDAVLEEDIIRMIGGEIYKPNSNINDYILPKGNAGTLNKTTNNIKKITPFNIAIGLLFAVLFGITEYFFGESDYTSKKFIIQFISIVFLGIALYNLIPKKDISGFEVQIPRNKRKIAKRTLTAAVMILVLIPLTLFVGVEYLGDRKYYFISLLIILETMLPFALIFEGRKPQARELVIISVLCAIAVTGRVAFVMLPQFKPVVALVIIAGVCFGGETGFLVGAITGFVSNFYFTQGPWTPWQMFAFGIIGFLAGVLFQKGLLRKSKIEICIFGFLVTLLIYGGIMNPASVIMSQDKITFNMIMSSIALGLPMDLIHSVSTAFFLWFALEPMCEKLDRIKVKYGIIE